MDKQTTHRNRLPHFQRAAFLGTNNFFNPSMVLTSLYDKYPRAEEFLRANDISSLQLRSALDGLYGEKALADVGYEPGSSFMTGILPYFFYYHANDGRHFKISTALDRSLQETTIKSMPSKFLRTPFKHIYIEFTDNHSSKMRVYNSSEDEFYPLNGAYISEFVIHDKNDIVHEMIPENIKLKDGLRIVQIALIGSPRALNDNSANDAFLEHLFMIYNEDSDVLDSLSGMTESFKIETSKQIDRARIEEAESETKKIFEHIFKCLIYLGSKNARLDSVNNRTEFEKRIQSKANLGKRQKLEQNKHKYLDFIRVGPNETKAYKRNGTAVDSEQKASIVRGHLRVYKNDRFYKNWDEEGLRTTWIEPYFKGAGEVEDKKTYLVK